MLYSRLQSFKAISAKLATAVPTSNVRGSKSSAEPLNANGTINHYETLLAQCEALFTNEIEQHVFEDQARTVFGVKVRRFPIIRSTLLTRR